MVDGELPGIPENKGYVGLATRLELFALGDLDGDGVVDAAAVFNCNAGGVGWPHEIVFYAAGETGPRVLGKFKTGDVVRDARRRDQDHVHRWPGSRRLRRLTEGT